MIRFAPALVLTAVAAAADPVWIKASTPNFDLYTNQGEKQATEVIRYFEEIRQFFGLALRSQRASTAPVRLILFRSVKEFQSYAPNDFAAAYYFSTGDHDFIVLREASQAVYRIAVHEYAHLILKHSGLRVPLWLNEGLAELYSTMKKTGKKTLVGDLIPGHVHQLQQTKWMSLEELLSVDHKSTAYNEKSRAGIFYAQSWALTHMLNLDEEYRGKFGQLIAGLNEDGVSASAFERTYGKPANRIIADLRSYMNGSRFNGALFEEPLTVSRVQPAIEAADEVNRGMLFATLSARDPVKARAAIEDLAKQYPGRPEPAEALAYMQWRQGDITGAIDSMKAAIAGGSTNAKLYFDCAMLSQMKGHPDADVARMLDKATDLRPDYREAYLRLASIRMRLKQYAQAVAALQQVKRVEPKEATFYFRTLAYANHQIKRPEEAIKNAELYRRHAAEPKEIEDADHLLRYIQGEREFLPADGRPTIPKVVNQGEVVEIQVPAGPELKAVEGSLVDLTCAKDRATVKVDTPRRGVLSFLIDDPGKIVIRGAAEGTFEFTCGPQKRTPVTLRYEERTNLPPSVTGLVREIEFTK